MTDAGHDDEIEPDAGLDVRRVPPDLEGLPDLAAMAGAMPDLGGILESFQRVQDARSQIYEGRAGGGAVVVRATGDLRFESVTISPEALEGADADMVQDLVLAALHDLTARMQEAQADALGDVTGPGGIDLGGLFG
ncbi:MAG: YbaB/EbfC family nucleoid-associated protein [Acidimicrobiia bacterium]